MSRKLDELEAKLDAYAQSMRKVPIADQFAADLRVLLAVAKAAKAIPVESFAQPSEIDGDVSCSVCGGYWNDFANPEHKPNCPIPKLYQALKAIK